MNKKMIAAGLLAICVTMSIGVYAQEQGYFTNGKERLRAPADWPGPQEQMGPPTRVAPGLKRPPASGAMIGASEANEPNELTVAQQNNELRELVRQMDIHNRDLALHQAQLEADLQRLRSAARDENAMKTADGIYRVLIREQQFGDQRRLWRRQLYDNFGLGRYEVNHLAPSGQLEIPPAPQASPQSDQGRRQSEQIGLQSK